MGFLWALLMPALIVAGGILVKKAFATVDVAKRNELVRQAETIEYNKGGYIIPNFKNTVDAYSNKLAGFVKNDVMGIPLGRWRLQKVYFK